MGQCTANQNARKNQSDPHDDDQSKMSNMMVKILKQVRICLIKATYAEKAIIRELLKAKEFLEKRETDAARIHAENLIQKRQ